MSYISADLTGCLMLSCAGYFKLFMRYFDKSSVFSLHPHWLILLSTRRSLLALRFWWKPSLLLVKSTTLDVVAIAVKHLPVQTFEDGGAGKFKSENCLEKNSICELTNQRFVFMLCNTPNLCSKSILGTTC